MISPHIIREYYEGIDGGKNVFWLVQRQVVAKFIKKYKIPAIEREFLPISDIHTSMEKTKSSKPIIIRPIPFPGGIRIPHLHFKGELYLLNQKQWKEIAGDAIKGFQEKMRRANTVSFNQLMELAEAVNTLG